MRLFIELYILYTNIAAFIELIENYLVCQSINFRMNIATKNY